MAQQSDLEELLRKRDLIEKADVEPVAKPALFNQNALKADKSAGLFDLVKMVDTLVSLTMKDEGVEFLPEEGKVMNLDAMKEFDHPYITYTIVSRKPKGELKSRVREHIYEEVEDSTRIGEVCGQKFQCQIQFNIIASNYENAEKIMEEFETLMMKYTGYFKRNGISELLFQDQYTDKHYARVREILSVRNLIYYVEIEKLTVIFRDELKDIEILATNKSDTDKGGK